MATDSLIILCSSQTTRYNLAIDRCNFDTAPGSNGQTAGNFVSIINVNKSVVSRFRMANGFVPIQINGGSVVNHVERGEIYNTARSGSLISINSTGNDQFINHLIGDNPVNAQPSSGIRIANSGGTWISDVDLIHSGNGLLLNPGNGQAVKWTFSSNAAFDSGVNGVAIAPTGSGVVYGFQGVGLWTSANTSYGVTVKGGDTIELVGSRVISNGMDGILMTGSAKNIMVRGGANCGNSSTQARTYSGINIGSGTQNVLIEGARIGDCVGSGTNMLRGIVLQPSNTTNNVQVTSNNLLGNYEQAISDNVTTAGANIRIVSNFGYNPVGTIIKAVGASPFTYTAGRTKEMLHLTGGIVSSVTMQGAQICTSSPCALMLPPNAQATIVYSIAPTLGSGPIALARAGGL